MKTTLRTYSDTADARPENLERILYRTRSDIVPRAVVRPEALSYHLLRPQDAGPADLPLLGEAYGCWSSVWKQHFSERDNLTYLPSDDFTRQDEVGALFHEWECIGMTSYRWVDLKNRVYMDDSYFKAWPAEAIEAACALGSRVCIGSSLTVSPPWRRAVGYSVKELLLALAIERFLRSDADVMVGTMRNDRGMDELGYRLGFRPLKHDVTLHGGPVDLVAFHRRSCKRGPLSPVTEAMVLTLAGRRAA